MSSPAADGVKIYDKVVHGFRVYRTCIITRHAAEALGRAIGEYVVIHTGRLCHLETLTRAGRCLAVYLRKYLLRYSGKNILICGLGNQDIVEDSLGPSAVKMIPAHIMKAMEVTSCFSSVAILTPGVPWYTNLKTETILSGVAKEMDAACVILIDSTHTESFENLASTIQITTGQMQIKGSGHIFDLDSLGIPIVGIGVPTVMHYAQDKDTDSGEMLMRAGIADDLKAAAFIIAHGISCVAYPKVGFHKIAEMIRAAP